MNQEIKKLWIDALRSGEYAQGQGYLCRNDTYCCLGVLSELAVKNNVITKKPLRFHGNDLYSYDEGKISTLSDTVCTWAGLSSKTGNFSHIGEKNIDNIKYHSLVGLNDSGIDFKTIADVIEEYL